MEQELSLNTGNNQLILNKPEELLLTKIREMQDRNLTYQKAEELKAIRDSFVSCYVHLAYCFFGLSFGQIKSLEPEQRLALANLIFGRAKPWARFHMFVIMPPLICIPIFGWLAIDFLYIDYESQNSFVYQRRMAQLKQMLGETDWFPHEALNSKE